MRHNIAFVALLSLALLTAVPMAVSADDVAGASGSCHDADGNGGDAHLAVTDEPGVDEEGILDEEDVENNPESGGAVDALAELANGLVENEDPAEACQSPEDTDYIEVHAAGAQVCYDGELKTGEPEAENPCPTRV